MQKQGAKNLFYISFLLLAGILGFAVRWAGIEHITADIETCLIPWSAAMKPGYGPSVLPTFDGDYNMPYITVLWLLNYLPGRTIIKVKLFSILFDYLGSVAAGLIVAHFMPEEKKKFWFAAAFTAVLFYPSAVLNSAYWGQCDFVYVTFLLYLIWALFKKRYAAAMILLGCAFSFKLQAVLILPVFLIYWWKKRSFSAVYFLLVPLVMEALCIPAIIGGSSVFIPFSVYLRQLGRYPYMYVFYPNFWALFREAPYYIFSPAALLSILAGLGIFAVAVIRKRTAISEKQWMEFAVWSVFFMMCFLPCMHERYGMFLEVLAIVYAFLNRKAWYSAVVLGAGSYIAYLQVTFAQDILSDRWIAAAYLLTFGFFTWDMVRRWNVPETDGALLERPDGAVMEKADGKARENGVFAIENRIKDWLNQYIIALAVIVLTVLAVLVRKPMMECMSPDYLPNLIEVEGNYHTPLYMFLMYLLSKISAALDKPLFFLVKLLCIGADILAAALVSACVYEYGKKRNSKADLRFLAFAVYGAMLFWPLILLDSSIWAHLDNIAIALLAAGYLLYGRKQKIPAGILAGLACGLLAHYLIWILIAAACVLIFFRKKPEETKRIRGSVFACLAVMLCSSLSGLLCGYSLWQSVAKLFGFWKDAGTWMCCPAILFVLILSFLDKRWIPASVLLEMAVVLDWGQFLYDRPVLPEMTSALLYAAGAVWIAVCLRKNKAKEWKR